MLNIMYLSPACRQYETISVNVVDQVKPPNDDIYQGQGLHEPETTYPTAARFFLLLWCFFDG